MLDPFAEEIWIATGEPCDVAGFSYPTRSVIVRLSNGALWVWSPSTLTDGLKDAMAELGPVAHLVAPNSFHYLSMGAWQEAYPDAQNYGTDAVIAKRRDLRWDHPLDDGPAPAWVDDINMSVVFNKLTTEAVFFHRKSGTVLVTDLLQQFDKGYHRGWRALVARLDLMTGEKPQVPRKFRLGFNNRKRARAEIAPILDWPAENLIVAHGAPIKGGAEEVLRQSFRWLMGR